MPDLLSVHLCVSGLRSSDTRVPTCSCKAFATLLPTLPVAHADPRKRYRRAWSRERRALQRLATLVQLRLRIGVLYRYVSGLRTEVSPRVPSGVRGWSWSALAMSHPTRSR